MVEDSGAQKPERIFGELEARKAREAGYIEFGYLWHALAESGSPSVKTMDKLEEEFFPPGFARSPTTEIDPKSPERRL